MKSLKKTTQQGFTIIELMIATSVLAVILLLVTVMITSIGNLYYKGVTLSQTQDTTRSIADQLVQDIKLSDGAPSNTPTAGSSTAVPGFTLYAICIGTTRYSYALNTQIGTGRGHIQHVMWRDSIGSGSRCSPVDLSDMTLSGGAELIGPRSRLTSLTIGSPAPGGTLYTVRLSLAYGDGDLLNPAGYDTTCKGSAGDQFCATDRLATSVVQRVSK